MEEYPSKLLADAIEQFSSLPGVGKRTAMRLALFLLKQEKEEVNRFGEAFIKLRNNIKYCEKCYNISEEKVCSICTNGLRDESLICVVEDVRDVMAIENTGQYKGQYHVLGGIISPMDGIGPSDIRIEELVDRVSEGKAKEVIMALSTTMEGDTTNFYIFKRLKDFQINISAIARGISVGDELEYADELTLGRSLLNRVPYENTLVR
ncbi:recombination mediator RecR [Vicingaceae bacterium]|nr:recombination mediator RecR [Vicingaceae bacterium]MDB4060719.1 recombination mediator RecR [Vicingaceae bacterium]MDB9964302.1 recombination mediator RecR [Vicingaceae bacterium]MDC1451995.1 recombination mediator RecR [Vicingaceae bacterium]